MAPNDFLRNGFVQYNLLEQFQEEQVTFPLVDEFLQVQEIDLGETNGRLELIDDEEELVAFSVGELESWIRITDNIRIRLNLLPPDYERYLIIQAESILNGDEVVHYNDPEPSNLLFEEASLLIENFLSQGLMLSNEAIGNRQLIETLLREILLIYSGLDQGVQEPPQPQHG